MKNLRYLIIGLSVTLSLAIGAFALASSYEWLTNFQVSPSTSPIHNGTFLKVYRNINTSGAFEEYRSVYYQFTAPEMGPSDSAWQEWTDCRVSGVVSGTLQDGCYPVIATSTAPTATSTLWIRATTNYGGCGTYTPTPNIGTCGDIATSTGLLYTP